MHKLYSTREYVKTSRLNKFLRTLRKHMYVIWNDVLGTYIELGCSHRIKSNQVLELPWFS